MKTIATLGAASLFAAALAASGAAAYDGLDETDAGPKAGSETEALDALPLVADDETLTTFPAACGCLAGEPIPAGCNVFDFRDAGAAVVFTAPAAVCAVILGSQFGDQLTGSNQDDVICAAQGDDLVWGRIGKDQIFGGQGDDKLHGGAGNDYGHGQGGTDICAPDVEFAVSCP